MLFLKENLFSYTKKYSAVIDTPLSSAVVDMPLSVSMISIYRKKNIDASMNIKV